MLARTTAFSTAGIVLVVFGSLIAVGPRNGDGAPVGDEVNPLALGFGLIAAGCGLAARVWYRNVRGDRLTAGMPSRTRDT
ncbi:MAG: hypothetical protein HYT80_08275 [Euryarchaeota archaeon]|nr:hypothetical protein [Euryarchaeota archaeon]